MTPLYFQLLIAASTDSLTNNIKYTLDKLSTMNSGDIVNYLLQHAMSFGLKILTAIVIYLIGFWIIKKIKRILKKIFTLRKMDESLSSFLQSLISISLIIFLIIITIAALGIDTSSLVALIAGSGLAIGMALSGTLQNFAGGIMILLFRPFKVGDFIEAQGYAGSVKAIKITSTEIVTPDRKLIILPNGALSAGIINNYSSSDIRRCDWKIGISYGNDFEKAKNIIIKMLEENPYVLKDPEPPFAALSELGDSAVVITVRAWTESKNYWALFFEMNARFYKELPQNEISFPFPQMDVHLDGHLKN